MKVSWVAVWVAAAALCIACGAAPNRAAIEQVERARADAQARPGARQAVAYADAVRDARAAGAYAGDPAALQARTEEALAMLVATAPHAGQDEPILVAWEGLLLADLGRSDDSWAAFQRSMGLRPNSLAARNVILVWSTAGKPAKVGETCAATVLWVKEPDELYDLIEFCRDHMNAVSDDAALAWATPDVRAFWEQERSRRAKEATNAEAAQQARDAKEQRVVRDAEICSAQCKQRGHSCLNHCGGDPGCENNCIEANHACLDVCESRAYKALGH